MPKFRKILHCDVNNFYASVEIIRNPQLKNKPLIVCGDPKKRHGIVLAKSNEAKIKGVKTAETVSTAMSKCRNLLLIPPHFNEYLKFSQIILDIYKKYSEHIECFGLDECWIDITHIAKDFDDAVNIANKIKNEVYIETDGLKISIGVSFTKSLAKLGSDQATFEKITVISPENFKEKIFSLPASSLLYVGSSMQKILNKLSVFTIGDLASIDENIIIEHLGKTGRKVRNEALGNGDDEVALLNQPVIPKSIGNGVTVPKDICNIMEAKILLNKLSDIIFSRMKSKHLNALGVAVTIKDTNFDSRTKQKKVSHLLNSSFVIADVAISLLNKMYDFNKMPGIRTLTITVFDLVAEQKLDMQKSVFDEEIYRKNTLDTTIDSLRRKYGSEIIKKGIVYGTFFEFDNVILDDISCEVDNN